MPPRQTVHPSTGQRSLNGLSMKDYMLQYGTCMPEYRSTVASTEELVHPAELEVPVTTEAMLAW